MHAQRTTSDVVAVAIFSSKMTCQFSNTVYT